MSAIQQYGERFTEEEVLALSKIDKEPYSWKVLYVLYGQAVPATMRQIRDELKSTGKFSGNTRLLNALRTLENAGVVASEWVFPEREVIIEKLRRREVVNSAEAVQQYRINPDYKIINIGKALNTMRNRI